MRTLLSAFLLLVFVVGAKAQSAKEVFDANSVYQLMLHSSYYSIDQELCKPILMEMIYSALQSKDTKEQMAHAIKEKCLDPHSEINAVAHSSGRLPFVRSTSYVGQHARIVDIPNFAEGSAHSLAEALYKVKGERIIIDLRYNPGGSVHELIQVLNFFSPYAGAPMFTFRYKESETEVKSTVRGYFAGHSIALLVNDRTGSSAEIFAAVLRNWFGKNLVVIGEDTYGKSSVQMTFFPIDASVKVCITTAVITAGSKEQNIQIHNVGVKPDIFVSMKNRPQEAVHRDAVMDTARRYYQIQWVR